MPTLVVREGAGGGGEGGEAAQQQGLAWALSASAARLASGWLAVCWLHQNPPTDTHSPGRLVWAKAGTYPWWPAKLLDPARDASFPPDADPPRPTAIPIRFFGTYDFAWIGSKRQLTDWEEVSGCVVGGGGGGRVRCGVMGEGVGRYWQGGEGKRWDDVHPDPPPPTHTTNLPTTHTRTCTRTHRGTRSSARSATRTRFRRP